MKRVLLVGVLGAWSTLLLLNCLGDDPAASTGGDSGTPVTTATGTTPTPPPPTPPAPPPPPAGDAGSDADAGPACDTTKPWGVVKALPGNVNSNMGEEYARPSSTGLELYFARFPGYDPRIWHATRATVTSDWVVDGAMEPNLNKLADGGVTAATAPTLTDNGLTMYLQFYDGANAGYANVYKSTRSNIGSSWATPTIVPNVNHSTGDDGAWVNGAGTRLYWFIGAPFHVVQSDNFAAPATLSFTGSTLAEERIPVLSADELTIWFVSYSAPPGGGTNKLYLYTATRTSTGANFGTPTYVQELNSVGTNTSPSWVSKDGCTMYLHSDRGGNSDIYYAERPQ